MNANQSASSPVPVLEPLIVSAPFGNYVQPAGATATLGTFTAARRPGRAWRILKTVRYYHRLRAWVNRIGLRNPGMPWLVERVSVGRIDVSDKIVSIHGFTDADWQQLLEQAARIRPRAVELNMSCPNVGEVNWPTDLFARAVATGLAVIVKLPPVNYELMVEQALAAGIRTLHCCNTLPVPAGGMSGKPLKLVSLQCIRQLRTRAYPGAGACPGAGGEALVLIGGGGITTPADIDDYAALGVRHVAIGTKAMNPMLLLTHRSLGPLIRHARQRLGSGGA